MRRKDREMEKEFALDIVDKASYGVLSLIDGDLPYGIPLSLVRDGDKLYFHSGQAGRKIGALSRGGQVSVAFVGDVRVPQLYTADELALIATDANKVGLLVSNVFTTEFESAIVSGPVNLVEDADERVAALRLICEKYTPDAMDYFDLAVEKSLAVTNVYRIEIESISGKRKKYDASGVEMKRTI